MSFCFGFKFIHEFLLSIIDAHRKLPATDQWTVDLVKHKFIKLKTSILRTYFLDLNV